MCAYALATLTQRLSATQASDVDGWWNGLAPAERDSLRRDAGRPPAGVLARFTDGESVGDDGDDATDFYEYLVNHEIYLDDGRTFHICSAHPQARGCLAAGHVPSTFQCPRRDAGCPMRALLDLAPGRDVRLSLVTDPRLPRGVR
jgi:hypothetical protein